MEDSQKKEIVLLEERPIIELPVLLKIFFFLSFFGLGLSFLFLPCQIVLTLFLGICLAAGILLNPFIGALLFVASAYLHPLQFMRGLIYSNVTTMFGLAVLFIWGFHILIYRDFYIPKSKQLPYFFGFTFIAAFSSFLHWEESSFYYLDLVKVFVLYFLIIILTRTKKHIFILVAAILILGLMTSLLAIYQSIQGTNFRTAGGLFRVTGFSDDPNDLALSLVLLLPFTVGLFAKINGFKIKAAALVLFFLYILTIILTFSRAVYLALPAVLILSIWKFVKKGRRFAVLIIILFTMVSSFNFLPQKVLHRIKSIGMADIDPSIWNRLDGYVVGLQMMADHPFVGIGIGRWQQEYWPHAFAAPLIRTKFSSVQHNIFIEVGSETGFIGLTLFVLLIFYALKDLRDSRRIFERIKYLPMLLFSQSLEIGLVCFLISTMFVAAIHVKFFWIILGFILALKNVALKAQVDEEEGRG